MRTRWSLAALILTCSVPTFAEAPLLKKGDRLAIVGDSITEQKAYSRFIEDYLLVCYPQLEVQCFQFGWGGERAPGFAARMENDLIPWKPNVVTTCYGMNDGSYRAYDDGIGKAYGDGMKQIIDRMKKAGVTVIVGSPGVVDSMTWNRGMPDQDQVYNANLEKLGEIAAKLAKDNGFPHADVFHEMQKTMIAAKAALGDEYPVAGGDGVHPGPNGHLIMAYAFLKAMGFDGDIGTITVDLGAGTAEATTGHNVLSSNAGLVALESSRYPFCFTGGPKDPNGTVSILPFTSFNQDLNRFVLKVKNLDALNADVTFGPATKTFTKQQLTDGINLAAEFLENPFVPQFLQVDAAVFQKEIFETSMIKGFITNFRSLAPELANDAETQAALATLRRKMTATNDAAYQKAKATVVPVKYTIKVTPKP